MKMVTFYTCILEHVNCILRTSKKKKNGKENFSQDSKHCSPKYAAKESNYIVFVSSLLCCFFFPTRIPGEYLFRPMKQVSTQKTDNEFFCSGHLAMMAMQTVRMIVILLVVVAFLNGMWVGEIIKFWFCDGPSNR